jgi:hypothetical protein
LPNISADAASSAGAGKLAAYASQDFERITILSPDRLEIGLRHFHFV